MCIRDSKNTRADRYFELETVDLDWSFLDGFEVKSVRPDALETDNSLGTLELTYSMKLGPGSETRYTLSLVATRVGVFVGEISVWDDKQFLSRFVQCEVVE